MSPGGFRLLKIQRSYSESEIKFSQISSPDGKCITTKYLVLEWYDTFLNFYSRPAREGSDSFQNFKSKQRPR